MVLYHPKHSQNQRGIAVHRPIDKRRASKARTTKSTYAKERTTYGYIDSLIGPKTAYSLQPALR